MISICAVIIAVALVIALLWLRKRPPATGRLRLYESKSRKRAIDHYQIAAEYDYERGDRQAAHDHYRRALEMVHETPEDAQFIVDRIGQRIRRPAAEADENHQFALDLQRHWDMAQTVVGKTVVLPGQQVWHEDTQNVHDTLLSDTVAENYRALKRAGAARADTPLFDIMRAIQQEKGLEGADAAVQMLGYINRQNAMVTKLNDTEPRLIQAVWKQVQNVGTRDVLQSFCTSLQDSWNGGSPHCVTGRNSRVVQCLAHMVPDMPEVGQLKTREALRNEIFQSSSKILETELTRSGLDEVWQKTEPTEAEQVQIDEVRERVRARISEMVDGYHDIVAADREKIKTECYAGLD
jgi:hypothetical protein